MKEVKKIHVVIAGGSGLIGARLTEILLAENFRVSHLGRHQSKNSGVGFYQWDPSKKIMDANTIKEADYIVNLAGESVAGKRWTATRKSQIIQSRLQSAALLQKSLSEIPNQVKGIICASAIGYYGDTKAVVDEQSKKGNGFLADTVNEWEKANSHYKIRTSIFRIGNVLSPKGGALKELLLPLNFFVNPFLGGGNQLFSWIHIDDLCLMIMQAIKLENLSGTFNAVAPDVVTQKEFMLKLKELKHSSAINIPVPSVVLKIILGEQASIVLEGANVSPKKIIENGFQFRYPKLQPALTQLINGG